MILLVFAVITVVAFSVGIDVNMFAFFKPQKISVGFAYDAYTGTAKNDVAGIEVSAIT